MAKANINSKKNVRPKINLGDHKCKICSKRFSDRSGLAHHVQLHSAERPFSCHLCPHTCKTKKYLAKHIKRVHNAATEHECTHCGRKFHYKSLLDHHMYIHTDERPFKCEVCGKGFNTSYSLSTHKYIHTDIKPFKCQYCDYACRDNSTLRKHHERHLGITKNYQCKKCDKSYKTKRVLKLHIAEVHLEMDLKKKPCNHCGKMFKSTTTLNTHIKLVHDKVYSCKCEICGVELSNKYNMAAHLTKHVPFKPYQCSYEGCSKKFKDKGTLKKHSLIHYPDKQFVCRLCKKRFTRINRLNVHMKQHKAKEKSAICDYCGTSFYSKNYLRSHIERKHCIREKFMCDACGFLTYNKPSLVMHIKYGHASETDRQCKICKKTFKMHKYLKLHYWNTHCIKYNMSPRRPKPKRDKIVLKDDVDTKEIELLHEVKVEPASDSDPDTKATEYSKRVLSEDISRVVVEDKAKEKTPVTRFEDFVIENIMRPESNDRDADEEPILEIRTNSQNRAKRSGNRMLKRVKRKTEMQSSVRKRQSRMVVEIDISGQPQGDEDREPNTRDTAINKSSDNVNGFNDSTLNLSDNYTDDESVDNDDLDDGNYVDPSDVIGDGKTTQSTRIKFNMHQCYVCFKLYETREKLINHCKEHFDVCNVNMLKKCPLCDYVTNLNLPRHMLVVHKLNIKLPSGTIRDRKNNNNGSRFYYNVDNDEKIKEIEVIPSVKNLNKRAYVALDKKKRESDNKGLTKAKLVKKDGEWIVEKEKIKIANNIIVPKINDLSDNEDYLGRMKQLYKIAKNNGQKMMFPCEKCNKICQTLSALKLHTRKHDPNPKPFKKKVWKHKLNEEELMKMKEKPKTTNSNRYENPKPIVNKHKCDPKLKEFYENTIKGGDIEFWQFLKIFNKMSRENVNDFADLENRTEFGIHFSLPETEVKTQAEDVECKGSPKKSKTKNAFKRTVMISRNRYRKRKAMIEALRRKLANSADT